MTPEEFKALIDVHGTDLTKWPHDRRAAATALLARDERARDLFADAQAFDALLREPEPVLSDTHRRDLTDGVMARIASQEAKAGAARSERHGAPERRETPTPKAVSNGWGSSIPWATLVLPKPGMALACASLGLLIGIGMGLSLVPNHVARGAVLLDSMSYWIG